MSEILPALFVSHGAAALTVDPDLRSHRALVALGTELRARKPRAVLMISAHDVRRQFTVATAARIAMLADHPAAHGRSYVATGEPQVAERVRVLLAQADISVATGAPALDHGAWVPLSLLFPNAEVPLVTLSLAAHQDPHTHFALGQALAPLCREGVLLIASGGATHSREHFRAGYLAGRPSDHAEPFSCRFDDWLVAAVADPTERQQRLLDAPSHGDFHTAHPTLDHWLPVLIAAGAGHGEPGRALIRGYQHSLSMTALGFGDALS